MTMMPPFPAVAPVTRVEFDKAPCSCGKPGCNAPTPSAILSRCHPDAPVRAWYHNGVLAFACATCNAPMLKVQVAWMVPS